MRHLIVLIFITISTCAFAQQVVVIGDTVSLNLTGYSGDIQWQESTDSLNWANIAGAITSPYQLVATASPSNKRFYRANVHSIPNCGTYRSYVIRHKLVSSTASVVIGNSFRGGTVFYVNGGSGLIGATSDNVATTYGCTYTVTGATSMTNGVANTAAILSNCASRPIAASICDESVVNGYTDWYMPAYNELVLFYQQRAFFSGLQGSSLYWCSTEYDQNYAWAIQFWDGTMVHSYNKNYWTCWCRAIRAYGPIGRSNSFTTLDISQTIELVQATVTGQTQTQTPNKCIGSNVTFSVSTIGEPPLNYQWRKNGLDIYGETTSTYTRNNLSLADEGFYTCQVTNVCRTVVSDNDTLKVIQLNANAGTDMSICNGFDTILNGTGSSNYPALSGVITYAWSPTTNLSSYNISNPTANPTTTTDYTVTITDQNGCTSTDVVNVFVQYPFNNERICLVTVDTVTWKNKIMWEKTTGVGTNSYNVYKEVALNVYNWIGTVPYNDPSFFIDYSSQPEAYANRYKIASVDVCQVESVKSYYHMTMNLTIAAFGSTMGLSWTHYIDASSSFQPSMYYIYRGTSPSNMQLLASVPGSVTSYNDINVFNVYYYMVGVEKASGCNTTKTPTYSFSNKKDNGGLVYISEQNNINSNILTIYPNPFKESATIKFNNSANSKFLMILTDASGRIVRKEEQVSGSEIQIEQNGLKTGVYFVQLTNESNSYRGIIMIE